MFNSVAQLVSYAGYDVVENQSGKRVGRSRISKKEMHISGGRCTCPH
ncbi:MAG: IS110 family transposase [Tannerellaceae bacterium]|nr:IS110 family transposase [Tannerellaceae bacterium]